MTDELTTVRVFGEVGASRAGVTQRLTPANKRLLSVLVAAGPSGLLASTCLDEYAIVDGKANIASSAFRMAVARLRKVIPEITNIGGRYVLDLDPEHVDLWGLVEASTTGKELPEATLEQLFGGVPFPGVELSQLVRTASLDAEAALVKALAALADRESSDQLLRSVRHFIERQLLSRPDVIELGVAAHVASAHIHGAAHLIEACAAALAEAGEAIPANLEEQRRSLLNLRTGEEAPDFESHTYPLPSQITAEASKPFVGRVEERARLAQMAQPDASAAIMVLGESGCGKTRLLSAAAKDLAASGKRVVALFGSQTSRPPLGVFTGAFPELATELLLLARSEPDSDAETEALVAFLSGLERLTVRGGCLLVDDAQWLDERSQQLLMRIIGSSVAQSWRVLLGGSSSFASLTWAGFVEGLRRMGVPEIEIGHFDHDELAELVGALYPQSSSQQRHFAARHLERIGASLPAVALQILRTNDPNELLAVRFPTTKRSSSHAIWLSGVAEGDADVASRAAVLGYRFVLNDLVGLSNKNEAEVLGATDRLMEAGVFVEGPDPTKLRFDHALSRAAFLDRLDSDSRRRLISAAVDLVEDPLARVELMVESVAPTNPKRAASALVDVGGELFSSGSPHHAVWAFELADQLDPGVLTAESVSMLSTALERIGRDGRGQRRQAFQMFLADDDVAAALEMVTANGLELERIEGDPELVEMLDLLGERELSKDQEFSRLTSLARHLGILGRHEDVLSTMKSARAIAETADEDLTAWVSAWPTHSRSAVAAWPELDIGLEQLRLASHRGRFSEVESIRAISTGNMDAARYWVTQCTQFTSPGEIPIQRWHAQLLDAAVKFTDGHWQQASTIANEAREFGIRSGIRTADTVRAAQAFIELWLCREYETIALILDHAPPDVSGSALFQAGRAATLASLEATVAHGQRIASEAVASAFGGDHPLAPGVAAIASQAVAPDDVATRDSIVTILEPFAGGAVVIGTGVANLGPAKHYLANVEAEPQRRRQLLEAAIEDADSWSMLIWQIALRAKLADQVASAALLREATELAQGTELEGRLLKGQGGLVPPV